MPSRVQPCTLTYTTGHPARIQATAEDGTRIDLYLTRTEIASLYWKGKAKGGVSIQPPETKA